MEATAVAAAIKQHEHTRTGDSVEHLKRAYVDSLLYDQGRYPGRATTLDKYLAVASAIRDRVTQRWMNTVQTYVEKDVRVVCYFSAEFLLGPHLGNNLLNLGIESQAKQAMEELGWDPPAILDQEPEPARGLAKGEGEACDDDDDHGNDLGHRALDRLQDLIERMLPRHV